MSVTRENWTTGEGPEFRINYVYDTFDRLVARDVTSVGQTALTGGETHYLYAQGQPYGDATATGQINGRYLFGPTGTPLAALPHGDTEPIFYLTDRQNSVLQIATALGDTRKRIRYSGLKVETRDGVSDAAKSDRFELGGQMYDGHSKLSMLSGHWFQPAIGRHLTEGGRGIGLNPYPVAENNYPNEITPQDPLADPLTRRLLLGGRRWDSYDFEASLNAAGSWKDTLEWKDGTQPAGRVRLEYPRPGADIRIAFTGTPEQKAALNKEIRQSFDRIADDVTYAVKTAPMAGVAIAGEVNGVLLGIPEWTLDQLGVGPATWGEGYQNAWQTGDVAGTIVSLGLGYGWVGLPLRAPKAVALLRGADNLRRGYRNYQAGRAVEGYSEWSLKNQGEFGALDARYAKWTRVAGAGLKGYGAGRMLAAPAGWAMGKLGGPLSLAVLANVVGWEVNGIVDQAQRSASRGQPWELSDWAYAFAPLAGGLASGAPRGSRAAFGAGYSAGAQNPFRWAPGARPGDVVLFSNPVGNGSRPTRFSLPVIATAARERLLANLRASQLASASGQYEKWAVGARRVERLAVRRANQKAAAEARALMGPYESQLYDQYSVVKSLRRHYEAEFKRAEPKAKGTGVRTGVNLQFPAVNRNWNPAQKREYYRHLGEQLLELNRLSLFKPDTLTANLARARLRSKGDKALASEQKYLWDWGAGRLAGHPSPLGPQPPKAYPEQEFAAGHFLDGAGGGYEWKFLRWVDDKANSSIGSSWSKRLPGTTVKRWESIQPGQFHWGM